MSGYDIEEYRRIIRAQALGSTAKYPLIETRITSREIKRIIANEWGIKLPEPYKYFKHNNCIPCFKAGKRDWYKVWRYYPERFYKAKEMEELIGKTVFKDTSLTELEVKWKRMENLSFERMIQNEIP
ncbi:MAG: hypothetical protein JRI54_00315 [Deltaproteobacteria bacterium]|nr:hypothetical protein [Deltaproteobacteria bacterium]